MGADYEEVVADGNVWVLTTDQRVAGLMVLSAKGDHIFVSNVAVANAYQGRGFGKRLLEHAQEQARLSSISELRLYTNERMSENLAIYAKLGREE